MPQNSTISNLPEDISVTIADYVAIVTPGLGQTRKAKLSSILSLATGAGAPNYVGKYHSLAALQTDIPTGVDGNYAIVTASPNDEEYIWDGDHAAWVKTENVPASTFALLGGNATDNASLAAALTSRDAAIGTETTNRTSADANIQSQVSALSAALIPHPTYTAPTAGISSTQSTGGLEIGQTINIPLTATFNINDGGSSTALSIKKNGTQIATSSPYTDSGVVISATPILYKGNFVYAQGPVKNNILGIPDAFNRIPASNVDSPSLSFFGNYAWYWGNSATGSTSFDVYSSGNKVVANSANPLTLNFNVNAQYPWFATDSSVPDKTTWFISSLNSGSIGGASNLFASPVIVTVTGLYTTRSYKLYMANYATTINSNIILS